MKPAWQLDLGARMIEANSGQFKVWAPFARTVAVELVDQDWTAIPMQPASDGYFEVTAEGVQSRARYRYLLNGKKARPDPARRSPRRAFQPASFSHCSEAQRTEA